MTTAYHIKAAEPLQQFTIAVLEPMGLVNDCDPPVNRTQLLQVRDDHFVRCYQSMEFVYASYSITLQCAFHVCHILICGLGKRQRYPQNLCKHNGCSMGFTAK